MNVNHSARTKDIIGIVFSSFFNMKLCCVFSLESPQRGYCNEYIGVGRFRILGGQGLEYWGAKGGGQIPSRHMMS